MPAEGFRLWHLTCAGAGCTGPLGPAVASAAPSVQPESAYSPVMAYIDSCLLGDNKKVESERILLLDRVKTDSNISAIQSGNSGTFEAKRMFI